MIAMRIAGAFWGSVAFGCECFLMVLGATCRPENPMVGGIALLVGVNVLAFFLMIMVSCVKQITL